VTTSQGIEGAPAELHVGDLAQFLKEDELAFVQIGPGILSVNHLAPYPTWALYKPLIAQAFNEYVQITMPAGIS
jgi:uncharacterized protein (TIGR04255 family)